MRCDSWWSAAGRQRMSAGYLLLLRHGCAVWGGRRCFSIARGVRCAGEGGGGGSGGSHAHGGGGEVENRSGLFGLPHYKTSRATGRWPLMSPSCRESDTRSDLQSVSGKPFGVRLLIGLCARAWRCMQPCSSPWYSPTRSTRIYHCHQPECDVGRVRAEEQTHRPVRPLRPGANG
jgi:hypothetical protein